ncbi:MAG TPA: hypothetical protein DIV39_07280 [Verrucomicrobiales bacterium]|nr:hypothetical protein [Verrucomicrobiales bacterium]
MLRPETFLFVCLSTLPRDFAMKLRGFSLLLRPLLVLLILTEYASATLVRTLDSGTITNGFILDSDELDGDPNTDLNGLLANFQATVSVASAPFLESHTADYRLAYQLRDSNGNPVRLVNGDALDTAYTAAETVSLTDFVIFPAVANPTQTINFRALPDPLAILSRTKGRYSVSGTLQVSVDEGKTWSDVAGTSRSTTAKDILHFTNLKSGDAQYNIRAFMTEPVWKRTQALETNPDGDSFQVSAGVFAMRYDDFAANPANVTATLTLDFDLVEVGTGTKIPLEGNGIIRRTWAPASHNGDLNRPLPDGIFSETIEADLKPLVQLKSGSETYALTATLTHEEDAQGISHADMACNIAPEQLLHFDGTLLFGSIRSTISEFANSPSPGLNGPDYTNTVIQVPPVGGTFPTRPDISFGDSSNLSVRLFDDGHMKLIAGSQTAYQTDGSADSLSCDSGAMVEYTSVLLDAAGATASGLRVALPQGLVFFPDLSVNRFAGEPAFTQPTTFTLGLNDHFCPQGTIKATLGPDAAVADESHPILFEAARISIEPSGELIFEVTQARYAHQDSFDLLEDLLATGQLDSPSMAVRCSNDRYFLDLTLVGGSLLRANAAADGTSRINADLDVPAGDFVAHFPNKTEITHANTSQIILRDGMASSGTALKDVPRVAVPYYQTCPGDNCTSAIPPIVVLQEPEQKILFLTTGGGLHAAGLIEAGVGHRLEWGKRDPASYAHRTSPFENGNFYMPGYQLYSTDNALQESPIYFRTAADHAASSLLLSGFNRDVAAPDLHLPSEPEYRNGNGDYAGLTFEVQAGSMRGASRLGGAPDDYGYDLLPDQDPSADGNRGSKYYIRTNGVSGRQVGTDGTYDPSLDLHGFPCKIKQFQLSFLDNTNEADGCASWVDGAIVVSGQSNWTQAFTGLRFDCLGEPGEMTPDLSDADGKSLTYWNSTFDLKTLYFITFENPPGACPKQFKAKLATGAKTRVSHVERDLFGTLAFCPDGNLSTLQDALDFPAEFDGIDSQLRLPATIPLTGPNKDYNLVATSKLRFNNPAAAGAPAVGFVTFAATIDIPYFRDLEVQAITTASGNEGAAFALTPGWEDGGYTFFNSAQFDPTHRGFPPAGISYSDYRDPANASSPVSEPFLIKAEQDMFGFIPLSYPLLWNDGTRRFASKESRTQDIFVAQMEHKLDWMDARFCNISFGATYDGLPQIKISNFLNSEIDAAADAISQALGELPKQAIDQGLSELEKMLEDALCKLINPLVESAAGTADDPGPIRDLYHAIYDIHETVLAGSNSYADFRSEVEQILNNPADLIFASSPALQQLRDHLCTISEVGDDASSFLRQIESALEDIINGIDAITQGINTSGANIEFTEDVADLLLPDIRGILYENLGGEREIVATLIDLLLENLVEPGIRNVIQPLLDDATSELNTELNELLTDIDPALDQIRETLLTVRVFLVDIHSQVSSSGEIADKFNEIVEEAKTGGLLNDLLRPVTTRAWTLLEQTEQALGIPTLLAAGAQFNEVADAFFSNYTEDEFVQLIKDELKGAILGSDLIRQVQYLLRQTLYDVADRVTSSLQSVLTEMSNVMKEVISDTIGALEDSINPLLGEVSDYIGSGEISGFAEFNGDSLRKLRLDARMQFEVPEEMELNTYLEILAYSSEDNFVDSGCVKAGEKVVEVRIGASDAAVEWISECRINLGAKLTLKDFDGDGGVPPLPVGVAGTFELSDGEIEFQTFRILEFGATLAIGLEECYIGAKARAIFSNYEVAAGIFFGRTCTLEPLLFVDPDIGDVVTGGTTFTGAYVYGEVWLPISELILGVPASCLFRIDAGVGAGAFYFLEGPTYGGKVFLGVSGEALCVVSIKGEIKIILASQAGRLRGAGSGNFSAKLGWCPFCVKFNKSVKLLYDHGDWSMQ